MRQRLCCSSPGPPLRASAAERAQERIEHLGEGVPELLILPIYSQLPSDLQARLRPCPASRQRSSALTFWRPPRSPALRAARVTACCLTQAFVRRLLHAPDGQTPGAPTTYAHALALHKSTYNSYHCSWQALVI